MSLREEMLHAEVEMLEKEIAAVMQQLTHSKREILALRAAVMLAAVVAVAAFIVL